MDYTFKFSIDETKQLISILGDLPAKTSANLLISTNEQINSQIRQASQEEFDKEVDKRLKAQRTSQNKKTSANS